MVIVFFRVKWRVTYSPAKFRMSITSCTSAPGEKYSELMPVSTSPTLMPASMARSGSNGLFWCTAWMTISPSCSWMVIPNFSCFRRNDTVKSVYLLVCWSTLRRYLGTAKKRVDNTTGAPLRSIFFASLDSAMYESLM